MAAVGAVAGCLVTVTGTMGCTSEAHDGACANGGFGDGALDGSAEESVETLALQQTLSGKSGKRFIGTLCR